MAEGGPLRQSGRLRFASPEVLEGDVDNLADQLLHTCAGQAGEEFLSLDDLASLKVKVREAFSLYRAKLFEFDRCKALAGSTDERQQLREEFNLNKEIYKNRLFQLNDLRRASGDDVIS